VHINDRNEIGEKFTTLENIRVAKKSHLKVPNDSIILRTIWTYHFIFEP